MKRPNPLLTPLGLGLTLALFIGLALSLVIQGGKAFSPGSLTAQASAGNRLSGYRSHAEFETECRLCHQPLKTIQAELCLDCHQEVSRQINSQGGIHSRIERVETCYNCHPDHRGRDFDPIQAAVSNFDHSLTRFILLRHQLDYEMAPIECSSCHDLEVAGYTASNELCQGCHAGQDQAYMQQHLADFSNGCLACHDGFDSLSRFDHAASQFSLEGKHIRVRCANCHTGGLFENTSTACESCHTEPEVHLGLFEADCSICHTASGWKPAVLDGVPFDHEGNSAFSLVRHKLDYQEQPVTCRDCHVVELATVDMTQCIACHTEPDARFIVEHREQFGDGCLECHDGVDRMSDYDHNRFFLLDGRHREIDCEDCHAQRVYKGAPTECSGCHAEPDIHAGDFGSSCQDCHTTTAWSPALLLKHTFPLAHGEQGEIQCQVCHPVNYVEYTCYNCHEHQPEEIQKKHQEEGITSAELPDCARCHPTGREHAEDEDD